MKQLLALALLLSPAFASAKTENWKIDPAASEVRWEGTKIGGGHHGTVQMKGGKLTTENGQLQGGELEADMTTLTVGDDMDQGMKTKLLTHLKSDDFFSVEKNPTAKLKITSVKPGKDGMLDVKGILTIKGIPQPTDTFPVSVQKDGKNLLMTADIDVDRTLYKIKYRSLKFFSDLGDKVIHDKFHLKVKLSAKP